MAMKSDASKPKHHLKRPAHAAHAHHAAHHHTKPKVFDVMRPGKAPASPTSRPVIVGHKPSAQKSQTVVSGIGESAPSPAKKVEIKPLHSAELEQSADVAASAVAVAPAVMTDPEDVPAGAPPMAPAESTTADSRPVLPIKPLAIKVNDVPEDAASDQEPAEPEAAPGPPAIAAAKPESDSPIAPAEPDDPPAPRLGDMPKKRIEPISEPQPETAETETAPEEPKPELKTEPTSATVSREGTTIQPPSVPAAEPDAAKADEKPADTPAPVPALAKDAAKPAEGKEKEKPEQKDEPFEIRDIVVSHHGPSTSWMAILLLMLVLLLAVAAVDILLDAEVVDFPAIPRTDYF